MKQTSAIIAVLLCTAPIIASEIVRRPIIAGYERFFEEEQASVEGGALLLGELSCTACHAVDPRTHPQLTAKRGPILDGAGFRLTPVWLRRFLNAPQAVKPGTTMPSLFADLDEKIKRQQIEALVHFLMSHDQRHGPKIEPKAANDSDDLSASSFQRGLGLYHQVGCVACHEPTPLRARENSESGITNSAAIDSGEVEPDDSTTMIETNAGPQSGRDRAPSIPLGDIAAKYNHETLTSFLHAPLVRRPSGRMPDLKLGVLEAADLAHYLLGGRIPKIPRGFETDDALVAQGRMLFESRGCANCHTLKDTETQWLAPPLTSLRSDRPRGCLGSPTRVDFALTSHQRDSLHLAVAAVANASATMKGGVPSRLVERGMLRMNCHACHTRNDEQGELRGGVGRQRWKYFRTEGDADFGDEGRIPPSLAGVGRKLTRDGLTRVLQGDGDIRHHMLTRMPKFGMDNVGHLVDALIATDGGQNSTPAIQGHGTPEDGRQLMNFGCVQCHPVNGKKMAGVVGVDLSDLQDRLQPAWFRDFLLNPESVKPRTRMPTFFVDNKSVVKEILDGEPENQVAALWAYLKQTRDRPLPEKLINAERQNFELIPKDEPILLRTFMRDAGTHAIAVGLPEQVHYAFDADQVRLAIAWRGRFLDAHGTWFDRFAPPAEPLGHALMAFPRGVPLAKLDDATAPWPESSGTEAGYRWLGFQLDKQGTPTFLYRFGPLHVAERLTPIQNQGLVRTIHLRGHLRNVWFRAATRRTADVQLRVRRPKSQGVMVAGEWRYPVSPSQGEATVEVEYRW